jgi:hypothetical protein
VTDTLPGSKNPPGGLVEPLADGPGALAVGPAEPLGSAGLAVELARQPTMTVSRVRPSAGPSSRPDPRRG